MEQKVTTDQINKRYEIPANIGFDPYVAWVWKCKAGCGNQGYKFENQFNTRVRREIKKDPKSYDWGFCNRCGSGKKKFSHMMSRPRAYHLNSIRLRKSNVNQDIASNL